MLILVTGHGGSADLCDAAAYTKTVLSPFDREYAHLAVEMVFELRAIMYFDWNRQADYILSCSQR